jgi:IS5 family transposase
MRVRAGEPADQDVLVDDDTYLRPFRPIFDPVEWRPSIPIKTYLRLMFLKYRFDLGHGVFGHNLVKIVQLLQ